MITCRDAVRLISQSQDVPLSRSQKLKLRMHLLVCGWCTRYQKQVQAIRAALRRRQDDHESVSLTDEQRGRMIARIRGE